MTESGNIGTFQLFHFKVIDYAGLFPPTSLSLDEAIKNFSKYRYQPEKWMLSRFIIPGSKLKELDQYKQLFVDNPPFLFSVLGKPSISLEDFSKDLYSLLTYINEFEAKFNVNVKVEALELKIPNLEIKSLTDNSVNRMINKINQITLELNPKHPLDIFLEIQSDDMFQDYLKILLKCVEDFNSRNKNKNISYLGFKLRTGGINASQFPSIEKVAMVIKSCKKFNVPLKATAGLHHPIRHYNESIKTKMLGFINVFGATILNDVHNLDIDTIKEILSEEKPSNFTFTDDTFSWKSIETHSELIYKSRIKSIISFGSCSFDEPIYDLRKLKFM